VIQLSPKLIQKISGIFTMRVVKKIIDILDKNLTIQGFSVNDISNLSEGIIGFDSKTIEFDLKVNLLNR
jgi:hypothetical protein